MAKILLVEDHIPTAQTLYSFLSRKHQVFLAPDLKTAYEKIDTYPFDLVFLDRMLPDGDSLEILEYLHDDFPQTRTILISSSKTADSDLLAGYQNHADDYLTKPFSLEMLSLRLTNQLNKLKARINQPLKWGQFTYYSQSRQLQLSPQKIITFPPRLAIIFEYLLQRHNSIVTREEFVDVICNRSSTGRKIHPRSIDVALRRLRALLGKNSQYLKSIHGLGYILTSPPTSLSTLTSSPTPTSPSTTHPN